MVALPTEWSMRVRMSLRMPRRDSSGTTHDCTARSTAGCGDTLTRLARRWHARHKAPVTQSADRSVSRTVRTCCYCALCTRGPRVHAITRVAACGAWGARRGVRGVAWDGAAPALCARAAWASCSRAGSRSGPTRSGCPCAPSAPAEGVHQRGVHSGAWGRAWALGPLALRVAMQPALLLALQLALRLATA